MNDLYFRMLTGIQFSNIEKELPDVVIVIVLISSDPMTDHLIHGPTVESLFDMFFEIVNGSLNLFFFGISATLLNGR